MERINKLLAHAGVASRRGVDALIRDGKITVNGKVVTELGLRIDPGKDSVKVSGRRVPLRAEPHVYFMLNKPRGVVSTVSDPQGRRTVRELLKQIKQRLFPVGRLDYASEGLLLMTNDGDLARDLTHPSTHVPKGYRVKVRGRPDEKALQRLREGVFVDGKKTAPCEVRIEKRGEHSWLRMTLFEGRNQQIRKMMLAIRHPVLKLKRVSIGGLGLGDLETGQYRPLTPREVERLRSACQSG